MGGTMKQWLGEFHEAFFLRSSTGIWLGELEIPLSVALSVDHQVEHLRAHTRLIECNKAFASMVGHEDVHTLKRSQFQRYVFKLEGTKSETLSKFVTQGYFLEEAIICDIDRSGRLIYVAQSLKGIICGAAVVRIWGMRRKIRTRSGNEFERVEALSTLTERQAVILRMTTSGFTLKEIGAKLGVSLHTIETHRLRLMKKFNVRSVPELVREVVNLGLDADEKRP